jgi:ABC-type Zn uptake system ZnuABC Zn-binding protein ZnuA
MIAMAVVVSLAVLSAGVRPVSGESSAPAEPLHVVATTTILADLAAQAGGDRVSVSSLVPKGGEVHTFDPSPDDAIRVADADVIVMNGLGLDEWLRGLAEAAGSPEVPIVELAEDLDGVTYLAPGHEEEASGAAASGDPHAGETANPHLWLDVSYAAKYVDRLIEAFSTVDPDHAADYAATGGAYRDRLLALDASIRERMAAIAEDRRRVVSFHEAFPYFAAAYGLTIVDTVVDDPGQEPSAADIAALIEEIRAQGVSAIFSEIQFPDDMVDTIAAETGVSVVQVLSDTLSDPPADSYEGMMATDVERILGALG